MPLKLFKNKSITPSQQEEVVKGVTVKGSRRYRQPKRGKQTLWNHANDDRCHILDDCSTGEMTESESFSQDSSPPLPKLVLFRVTEVKGNTPAHTKQMTKLFGKGLMPQKAEELFVAASVETDCVSLSQSISLSSDLDEHVETSLTVL